VHTRLWYRAAAASAGLAVVGLLVTGGAAAAPAPTVGQVQAKLTQLDTKSERLDQQLDQVQQELQAASQRLGVVNSQVARFTKQFQAMQAEVGEIAAQTYMQGSLNSSIELLTSGDPQQVLNQSSILTELSASNNAEMTMFLAAARRLNGSRAAAEHTEQGIAALRGSLTGQKQSLGKLISQQQTLLAQLSPAQQTGLGPGTPGPTAPPITYTGPTSTQAQKAVAFAYAQLGCPYVFGGTGPCRDGFDCSGLTMQAWASAGVSIERTSYEQWDSLPHVSISDLEPGDILVFTDAGHVGIYVGGGYLIDAPQTGEDVERVALSGWYTANLDGAVRP
jgi:cell wall-associated NlpC family hydrolase